MSDQETSAGDVSEDESVEDLEASDAEATETKGGYKMTNCWPKSLEVES